LKKKVDKTTSTLSKTQKGKKEGWANSQKKEETFSCSAQLESGRGHF
jgi:hypothetical protein